MTDEAIDYDLKTLKQVDACGYEAIQRKGQGSYGFVYEVEDSKGDIFAFKYILPDVLYKNFGLDSLNEIDILSRVDHPHIIHAAKIITAHNCEIDGLAVILPLADRTLFDLMTDINITTDIKLPIFYKLATALEFLHRNHILHLDIKSSNVVIQDIHNNYPYLIDFGLSMIVDDVVKGKQNNSVRVTLDHRAPEILAGSRIYNAAVDIWAFGIMMLYTICGHGIYNVDFKTTKDIDLYHIILRLFNDDNYLDLLLHNVREKYRFLCKDLLSKILQIDPIKRLTALDICNHQLFNEFRYPIDGILIEPKISYDYAIDHRDIIKLIIYWAKEIYPNSRVEHLFLSVDLFNRVSNFYKDRNPLDRLSLGATSLWLAAKLTNSILFPLDIFIPFINNKVPQITSEHILNNELEIIHLLSGILDISKIYRECTTVDELILSFDNILISKDSTLYARVDVPEWIATMKDLIKEPQYNDKNVTITNFIQ